MATGYTVLCLLAGCGWVVDQALPGLFQGLLRTAVHDGVLAVVFLLVGRVRVESQQRTTAFWCRLGCGFGLLLALPQIVIAGAGGHVSQFSVALLFLLVPMVVIVVVAQQSAGFGPETNPLEVMFPALLGIGGAALVIPFDTPASISGKLWLLALTGVVILSGVIAVWLHRTLAGVPVFRTGAIAMAAACLVATPFSLLGGPPAVVWSASAIAGEAVRCFAIDLPVVLLTVWLLREMRPVAFSARALLIPLVSVAAGLILLRPEVPWTTPAGMLLMGIGAWRLLASGL